MYSAWDPEGSCSPLLAFGTRSGQYATTGAFAAHVRLTLHNCIRFNAPDSDISALAVRLGALFERLWSWWVLPTRCVAPAPLSGRAQHSTRATGTVGCAFRAAACHTPLCRRAMSRRLPAMQVVDKWSDNCQMCTSHNGTDECVATDPPTVLALPRGARRRLSALHARTLSGLRAAGAPRVPPPNPSRG